MTTTHWQQGNGQQHYTLTQGTCVAMVWLSLVGVWAASVQCVDRTRGRPSFGTREDAQAWCLLRLAEFGADGLCGE